MKRTSKHFFLKKRFFIVEFFMKLKAFEAKEQKVS